MAANNPITHELEQRLRALAAAVFAAAPAAGGKIRLERQVAFTREPHSLSFYEEYKPAISWPGLDIGKWIASFPEYVPVVELLEQSEPVKRWVATRVQGPDLKEVMAVGLQLLVQEVVASVCEQDRWSVSEQRWLLAMSALRMLVERGRVEHRSLAMLHGLRVDKIIDLGGIYLRPPSDSERLLALDKGHLQGAETAAASCGAAIDVREDVDIGSQPVIGQQILTLLLALRVWTAHPIASMAVLTGEGFRQFSGSSRPSAKFFPGFAEPPLLDLDGFKTFWQRTRDVLSRPAGALGVALRRMELMIDHERDFDRVLDLCIILEAPFQKGDEKQELSYRLRLRTAHFIGDTLQERKEVFKVVRDGYGLRSKIAHGSSPEANDQDVQDNLANVVYRVLRRYCEKTALLPGDSIHDKIIKEMDDFALERSSDPR